ncbi:uncharacterized protein LOC110618707 isoform X2 [Manihot esculenta]|uniref:uncharacterized protein LOC110618707 isoform X2 n=1 Tax=Manihot esculenta TaxID=3983 RepID=UPI001CC8011A|nr:uncharacterized protein LOC110618707 isoform X2 [Manihot esculenta]
MSNTWQLTVLGSSPLELTTGDPSSPDCKLQNPLNTQIVNYFSEDKYASKNRNCSKGVMLQLLFLLLLFCLIIMFPFLAFSLSFSFTVNFPSVSGENFTFLQVGLKRIDAAVDALRSMGFPEALVRRTAYGGDDGWTFIEECSYKLLIDSILEEQEKSGRENSEPKPLESSDPTLLVENQVSEDGIVQDNSGAQVHSPQGYSKQVQSPSIESPSPKKLALHLSSKSHSSSSTAAEAVPSFFKNEQCHGKLGRELPSFQISAGVCSPQLFSPPPVKSPQAQSSKPCYGWLSEDDDDDE